ncbi:unnamed protein product [Periconia digitata]|uniref:Zn(2)-C6 fungal-type domain-containing protein n=1 Tax=Periconia digitata TaxID=1303443 RepID=A0A9W4UC49_9PLEO|nr:unnamed protein product [Periconia digitata]
MSSGSADATEPAPKKTPEHPLNRACEACRVSKVRCLPNPNSTSNQCQRCTRAGRLCIFAAPAKRRQRKRTDVRVAELEREVKQLTSLLRPSSSKSPIEEEPSDSSMDEDEATMDPEDKTRLPSAQERRSSPQDFASFPTALPMRMPNPATAPQDDLMVSTEKDILDRGVITIELAEELLNIYRDELNQQFPSVVVDKEWTVQDLRTKKPALFHAVMAAASHVKGSALSNKLHEEIIYYYARNVFIMGEKGLQWVQAFFVTISYWTPPSNHARLQIFSYASIAASMALEIGLTTKPRTHEQLPKRVVKSYQKISSPGELLENCRTTLSLYIMTAGFSIRFRRPYILIYNSWMEECLHILSKSPSFEDRKTVAWLRLQRIADEAYVAFGFDDASTSFTLSEIRLQTILKIFERRMQDWKKSVPEDVWTPILIMEYHQNVLSMWEFAMDGGRYDAPEFRNRHLTLPALDDDGAQPENDLARSSLQVNATIMCISCAQAVLDTVMELPALTLRKIPGVMFARCIYSLVVLLRADYAVGTDAEGMGEFLDSATLKIDYYLDTLMSMTKEAIGPQKCKIPTHWLFVLTEKIKKWHDEHMQWRREGKHLSRNRNKTSAAGAATADTSTSSTTQFTPPEASYPDGGIGAIGTIRTAPSTSTSPPAAAGPPSSSSFPTVDPDPATIQQQQPHLRPSSQFPLPSYPPSSNTPWSWQPLSLPFQGLQNTQQQPPPPSSSTNSNQANNGFAGAPPADDMMDLGLAFSQGDLYLWNETADAYDGWMSLSGGNLFAGGAGGGAGAGGGFDAMGMGGF